MRAPSAPSDGEGARREEVSCDARNEAGIRLAEGTGIDTLPPVLAWSLRSAATLGAIALAARPPASAAEALGLAVAALVVAALAVWPAEPSQPSA